jgi:uncharacterized protein with PIN domain
MELHKTAEAEIAKPIAPPEDLALQHHSSVPCPQCNRPISWHWDGEHWHGHCSACMRKLRGKLNDSASLEIEFFPEDHIYHNVRGC